MAANENVFGVSDHVKEVVAEEMQNICRYPGDRNQELFEQIGKNTASRQTVYRSMWVLPAY